MTLEQIAEDFKIPLVKVKRLAKAGLLNYKPVDARISRMKNSLRCKNHLSVLHCLALIREPALLAELGPQREAAESQLRALGNVSKEHFGEVAANLIYGAAIMDPKAIETLAAHIPATLPPGLSYHALGARLLWGISGPRLFQTANYLKKAITNLQNHPDLQTWFNPGTLDL